MTQEDIIRMAREAGDDWDSTLSTDKELLKRFAALVETEARAEEREACAKVCEDNAGIIDAPSAFIDGPSNNAKRKALGFADAIRARGQA